MKKDESWDCIHTEDTLTASGFRSVVLSEQREPPQTPQTPHIDTNTSFRVSKKSDVLLCFCFLVSFMTQLLSETFFPLNQGMRIGGGLHFNSVGHGGRHAF